MKFFGILFGLFGEHSKFKIFFNQKLKFLAMILIANAQQAFLCPEVTLECKELHCHGELHKATNKAGECCCRLHHESETHE